MLRYENVLSALESIYVLDNNCF